jgi:hypothetical protein
MDLKPHLRDIRVVMWIRPRHQPLARMPSMRPQPTAPAPGSVKDMQRRRAPQPTQPSPLTEEEAQLAGGFHESSYELRTGMDIVESDWPDDVTIPRPLDEG